MRSHATQVCDECGLAIEPGKPYEWVLGLVPSLRTWHHPWPPNNYRTCAVCVEIREEFFCEGWSYGLILEDLCAHLEDVVYEGFDWSCLDGMSAEARNVVLTMIQDIWDDYADDDNEELL